MPQQAPMFDTYMGPPPLSKSTPQSFFEWDTESSILKGHRERWKIKWQLQGDLLSMQGR